MKKTLSVFATLALLFFGAACVPQETNTSETGDKEGNTETSNAPSVTIGADNISAVSVVLKGKANLTSSVSSDLSMGIMWSKNAGVLPSNSTKTEATNIDGDYNYSVGVTGLEPETTYYYRSYVTQNGQDTYGETLSFVTKEVSSLLETLDATEVEATTATLNAKLDLTNVRYTNIAYGFYWGNSEQELMNEVGGGEIINNGIVSSLTNLSHKTQYWYKAYIHLDNQTFYGDVKTFSTASVPVESIILDKKVFVFYTIGSFISLKATVLPADATDRSVDWSSDNANVASVDSGGRVKAVSAGTAHISAKAKDGSGVFTTCEISVQRSFLPIDLGLPSGLKWAHANVGANAPEETGDYYGWGEIEPHYSSLNPLIWKDKDGYDWMYYRLCNGSASSLTKYNSDNTCGTVDNKFVLEPEDDIAQIKLGGSWHIPTAEEWGELFRNCTWTSSFPNGEAMGYTVTGPNGNSIFLPCAGMMVGRDIKYPGSFNYWSSSLWNRHYAQYVYVSKGKPYSDDYSRYAGFPIRAVSE